MTREQRESAELYRLANYVSSFWEEQDRDGDDSREPNSPLHPPSLPQLPHKQQELLTPNNESDWETEVFPTLLVTNHFCLHLVWKLRHEKLPVLPSTYVLHLFVFAHSNSNSTRSQTYPTSNEPSMAPSALHLKHSPFSDPRVKHGKITSGLHTSRFVGFSRV